MSNTTTVMCSCCDTGPLSKDCQDIGTGLCNTCAHQKLAELLDLPIPKAAGPEICGACGTRIQTMAARMSGTGLCHWCAHRWYAKILKLRETPAQPPMRHMTGEEFHALWASCFPPGYVFSSYVGMGPHWVEAVERLVPKLPQIPISPREEASKRIERTDVNDYFTLLRLDKHVAYVRHGSDHRWRWNIVCDNGFTHAGATEMDRETAVNNAKEQLLDSITLKK